MRLAQRWRNKIILAVVAGGLDKWVCEFEFDEEGGVHITHPPTGSSFILGGNAAAYNATSTVGDESPRDLLFTLLMLDDQVKAWAREVKEFADMPDLWAELQREREILTGTPYEDAENTPFTQAEQDEIAKLLRAFQEQLETKYDLSQNDRVVINAHFTYLIGAAGRVRRLDWRKLAMWILQNVLVPLVITAVLQSDEAHDLFQLAMQALDSVILGGAGPELPPQIPPLT